MVEHYFMHVHIYIRVLNILKRNLLYNIYIEPYNRKKEIIYIYMYEKNSLYKVEAIYRKKATIVELSINFMYTIHYIVKGMFYISMGFCIIKIIIYI